MFNRFTEEFVTKVIEMYGKNISQVEIAKTLGVKPCIIALTLRENGINKESEDYTSRTGNQIRSLLLRGYSQRDVAEELKIPLETIQKVVKDYGIENPVNRKQIPYVIKKSKLEKITKVLHNNYYKNPIVYDIRNAMIDALDPELEVRVDDMLPFVGCQLLKTFVNDSEFWNMIESNEHLERELYSAMGFLACKYLEKEIENAQSINNPVQE